MEKIDEVLAEIRELKSWLYGKNGFEGDIPEIKAGYRNHSKRIRRLELILAGSGVIGAFVLAAVNLLKEIK